MYEETRDKINGITGLSRPEKRGFNMVLDEISQVKGQLDNLTGVVAQMQQAIAANTKLTAETLALANTMHKNMTENNDDAAQMRGIRKILKSRHFWYGVGVVFVAIASIGVAVAYFIEHSHEVTEIGGLAK